MLRLIPVVDGRWLEQSFDWAPVSRDWLKLHADVSNGDIAYVVATLASFNDVASSGSVEDAVRALEKAEDLSLPGGLMIRTDGLEISPSCCCGLESWREWYGVAPGGSSPWLGHSPLPWVECKDDCAVLWADGELGKQSPNVSVAYSEIDAALQSAHAALAGFTAKLSDWLSEHAPQSTALSRRFGSAFDVS